MKKKNIHTEIIHLIKLTIRLYWNLYYDYTIHIITFLFYLLAPIIILLERNANHVMMHVGLFGLIWNRDHKFNILYPLLLSLLEWLMNIGFFWK